MSDRKPEDYKRALAAVVKITMDALGEPVCLRCKHPVGTLVHTLGCAGPAGRICIECDHRWNAADKDATETCPRDNCNGIGEPL